MLTLLSNIDPYFYMIVAVTIISLTIAKTSYEYRLQDLMITHPVFERLNAEEFRMHPILYEIFNVSGLKKMLRLQ
jgi:hypothetical protein